VAEEDSVAAGCQSKSEFSRDDAERPDVLFGADLGAGFGANFGAGFGAGFGANFGAGFGAGFGANFGAGFESAATVGLGSSGSGFDDAARTLFNGEGADTCRVMPAAP